MNPHPHQHLSLTFMSIPQLEFLPSGGLYKFKFQIPTGKAQAFQALRRLGSTLILGRTSTLVLPRAHVEHTW